MRGKYGNVWTTYWKDLSRQLDYTCSDVSTVIALTKARFLDTAGVAAAVFVGLLVGH